MIISLANSFGNKKIKGEEKWREQEDKSRIKEREPQRLRSTTSDRQTSAREAIATTMILPVLPEIKKQQEIIEESMKSGTKSLAQKQETPQKQLPSLTERLKEKQALADRLNNKRALKPKIRRQNEATLWEHNKNHMRCQKKIKRKTHLMRFL